MFHGLGDHDFLCMCNLSCTHQSIIVDQQCGGEEVATPPLVTSSSRLDGDTHVAIHTVLDGNHDIILWSPIGMFHVL